MDESLDEPESLDCELLDDESLADALDPDMLGRLIDVLESLDSLVDESLDWESDELPDESLDADDDPSELDEPLMLGRLVESLDSLSDESLDCEVDELPDEPLEADEEPSELDELLTLGRLVDVPESLLPDESLD